MSPSVELQGASLEGPSIQFFKQHSAPAVHSVHEKPDKAAPVKGARPGVARAVPAFPVGAVLLTRARSTGRAQPSVCGTSRSDLQRRESLFALLNVFGEPRRMSQGRRATAENHQSKPPRAMLVSPSLLGLDVLPREQDRRDRLGPLLGLGILDRIESSRAIRDVRGRHLCLSSLVSLRKIHRLRRLHGTSSFSFFSTCCCLISSRVRGSRIQLQPTSASITERLSRWVR
jgi:hypothetical protein